MWNESVRWMCRGILMCLLPAAAGCEDMMGPVPVTAAQYDQSRRLRFHSYPDPTVFSYNMRRVWDAGLPAEDRIQSLELVVQMGGDDPQTARMLAEVVTRPGVPNRLQYALLEYQLKKGQPDAAERAVNVLEDPALPPGLRDASLNWLSRHPTPDVLAQTVKLWAQEPSPAGPNETRYRQVVERITGKAWDQALLDGLNMPGFYARGSAIEVLAARLDHGVLRTRIDRMAPATTAVSALQVVSQQFDYLPTDRAGLLAVTAIYNTRAALVIDAARLGRQWAREGGYRFVPRDFHVLSRLARDPLRKDMRRSELIVELGRAVAYRKHVQRKAQAGLPVQDTFAAQVARLTMADLWNLYLLNEMLSRPRVQLALRTLVERDLADTRTAWGGLVFYENGQAEAKLYEAAVTGKGDDLRYVASPLLEADGGDSLCRLLAHFEKVANADRAGPTAEELKQARDEGYYGLVLTSIDGETFTAHYYNPSGTVVSLGTFPLGRRGG